MLTFRDHKRGANQPSGDSAGIWEDITDPEEVTNQNFVKQNWNTERNWLNYFYTLSPEESTAQRLFCAAGSPHSLEMK